MYCIGIRFDLNIFNHGSHEGIYVLRHIIICLSPGSYKAKTLELRRQFTKPWHFVSCDIINDINTKTNIVTTISLRSVFKMNKLFFLLIFCIAIVLCQAKGSNKDDNKNTRSRQWQSRGGRQRWAGSKRKWSSKRKWVSFAIILKIKSSLI